MLIERFENIKNLINELAEGGRIEGLDLLNLREMVLDVEDFIETEELYYRVNTFKSYLDVLEEEIYNTLQRSYK